MMVPAMGFEPANEAETPTRRMASARNGLFKWGSLEVWRNSPGWAEENGGREGIRSFGLLVANRRSTS